MYSRRVLCATSRCLPSARPYSISPHPPFDLSSFTPTTVASVLNRDQPPRGTSKKRKKKQEKKKPTPQRPPFPNAARPQGAPHKPTSDIRVSHKADGPRTQLLPLPDASLRNPPQPKKHTPPHSYNTLTYSRRLEGLLEPSERPTLEDVEPTSQHRPIPKLAHGLDRVLFNPGVHWLQDPRSRVYNFSPYLENIPKVTEFAFERLVGFVKSSRDEDLWDLAKRENRKYAGSTSSLSGMLSHIYFLISGDKTVNTSKLSAIFQGEPKTFTPGQRMPVSVVMTYNDGVYAIDSGGKDDTEKNILTWMGTLLEKFLTMTSPEFSSYRRSEPPSPEEEEPLREAYRYAKSEQFVMRSQLDCQDSRLPGTGVFDLKTRACLPIRMDILNFEENSGYLIKSQTGLMESFEKEYFDLIRSAFLKYSFQVRIGNMDGVIVAYHNTARMFGFQYIPLQEMDEAIFAPYPGAGDRVFEKCIKVLECITSEITCCFPKQSVQCTFEKEEKKDVLNIWVEPVEWEGDEDDRPIRQLEVEVTNFLGSDVVKGSRAVSEVQSPWILHYAISRLSGIETDVRSSFRAAKSRQFRGYNIPSGVENMEDWWERLNFGDVHREEGAASTPYDAKHFKQPGKMVQQLRSVSRSGREETERLATEELGKPRYVLGEDAPIPAELLHSVRKDVTNLITVSVANDNIETLQRGWAAADASEVESMSDLDPPDALVFGSPAPNVDAFDAAVSTLAE